MPPSDGPPFDADWKRAFRRRLLAWYATNARDLPWRRSRDPYRVWVSEVMLQQTQVETVCPYFDRFMQAFPTVADLARAPEEKVLRLWEGLGYYRRARSLHAAAKVVVREHRGVLPGDTAGLMTLPGVGRYTAGAIVSIAHDKPAPILEANTIRLLTRLSAYQGDPTRAAGQRFLWGMAEDLLPKKNASRFNQALMELGSLVCSPKSPRCDSCPVNPLCRAYTSGAIHSLSATTKKIEFTSLREAVVVVRKGSDLLVRQCGEQERWAGLWDFPRFEIDAEGEAALMEELRRGVSHMTGVDCDPGPLLTRLKHGVTRYRITLECYEARRTGGRLARGAKWMTLSALGDLPMSVTGRKLVGRLSRSENG